MRHLVCRPAPRPGRKPRRASARADIGAMGASKCIRSSTGPTATLSTTCSAHGLPYHPLWERGLCVDRRLAHDAHRCAKPVDAEATRFFGLKRECGLHDDRLRASELSHAIFPGLPRSAGAPVLVVGGGAVAARKSRCCARPAPSITVVAPHLAVARDRGYPAAAMDLDTRAPSSPRMCPAWRLVIAATDDRAC